MGDFSRNKAGNFGHQPSNTGQPMNDHTFQYYKAQRSRAIFFRDLPFHFRCDDLCQFVSNFLETSDNTIEHCVVKYSAKSGKTLQVGIVMLVSEEVAKVLMERVQNSPRCCGRDVRVSVFDPHAPIEQSQDGALNFNFNFNSSTPLVTEEVIRKDLEEQFGVISSVCIRGHYKQKEGGQNGFGFVTFQNPDIHVTLLDLGHYDMTEVKYAFCPIKENPPSFSKNRFSESAFERRNLGVPRNRANIDHTQNYNLHRNEDCQFISNANGTNRYYYSSAGAAPVSNMRRSRNQGDFHGNMLDPAMSMRGPPYSHVPVGTNGPLAQVPIRSAPFGVGSPALERSECDGSFSSYPSSYPPDWIYYQQVPGQQPLVQSTDSTVDPRSFIPMANGVNGPNLVQCAPMHVPNAVMNNSPTFWGTAFHGPSLSIPARGSSPSASLSTSSSHSTFPSESLPIHIVYMVPQQYHPPSLHQGYHQWIAYTSSSGSSQGSPRHLLPMTQTARDINNTHAEVNYCTAHSNSVASTSTDLPSRDDGNFKDNSVCGP